MDELGTSSVGDKAALRAQIRSGRRSPTPADRDAAGIAIASNVRDLPLPGHLGGMTVTCYLSLETEPGTGPLIEDLLARGASVLVPRVAGEHLDWLILAADQPVSAGPFGIPEPAGIPIGRGIAPLAGCTALFLPALAIDDRGYRLGQGGGFYDRTLGDPRPGRSDQDRDRLREGDVAPGTDRRSRLPGRPRPHRGRCSSLPEQFLKVTCSAGARACRPPTPRPDPD